MTRSIIVNKTKSDFGISFGNQVICLKIAFEEFVLDLMSNLIDLFCLVVSVDSKTPSDCNLRAQSNSLELKSIPTTFF